MEYNVYKDERYTEWYRKTYRVKADSVKEAVELIKQNVDDGRVLCTDAKFIAPRPLTAAEVCSEDISLLEIYVDDSLMYSETERSKNDLSSK